MPGVWSNLGQGDEYEPSFMHPGVWDLKNGSVKALLSVQKNVQVDGARGGRRPSVWAAQTGLDLLTALQQFFWR
jgi:hypothetical protein